MTRPRIVELDSIDRLLLHSLQEDCKQPLAKLGEQVGLSAPAVLERVRKMEAAGVICAYRAVVEPQAIGLDIGGFIGVGISHPHQIADFEEAVRLLPDVLECHHVTGRHTLIVKLRTENTASLHELISKIRGLPGVERTESMIVLETQFERQHVAPPEQDEPEEERTPRRRTRGAPREAPAP